MECDGIVTRTSTTDFADFFRVAAYSVEGWDGSVTLDQFAFSQTIDTFAAQITCTNADVSISGTIAFNVQNIIPGAGVLPLRQSGKHLWVRQ